MVLHACLYASPSLDLLQAFGILLYQIFTNGEIKPYAEWTDEQVPLEVRFTVTATLMEKE